MTESIEVFGVIMHPPPGIIGLGLIESDSKWQPNCSELRSASRLSSCQDQGYGDTLQGKRVERNIGKSLCQYDP